MEILKVTKNDTVEINNKNYESTKKALEAYEKKLEYVRQLESFQGALREQIHYKVDDGNVSLYQEATKEQMQVDCSLAYGLEELLGKRIERLRKELNG